MTPTYVHGLLSYFGEGAQLRTRVKGGMVQVVVIYNGGNSKVRAEKAVEDPRHFVKEDFK